MELDNDNKRARSTDQPQQPIGVPVQDSPSLPNKKHIRKDTEAEQIGNRLQGADGELISLAAFSNGQAASSGNGAGEVFTMS